MSKSKGTSGPVGQPQSSMISTQTAVYMLNNKIQKLEEVMKMHMDDIEGKFGEHEAYVTDNIPDLDLINKALSDINTRLIDLEGLDARIAALENGSKVNPTKPVSPSPVSPTLSTSSNSNSTKKKGTVKLADMTPTPVVEPGISFS